MCDTCTNSVSPVNAKEGVIKMEGRYGWGGGVRGGHACVITRTNTHTHTNRLRRRRRDLFAYWDQEMLWPA